jgi:hypothetical protein
MKRAGSLACRADKLRAEAIKALDAAGGDRWQATAALIAWLAQEEPMTAAMLGPTYASRLRAAARTLIDAVDAAEAL